jgi:hypothetical protein
MIPVRDAILCPEISPETVVTESASIQELIIVKPLFGYDPHSRSKRSVKAFASQLKN